MLRRLVAKRLTESDLTLFEWHFRRSASNQKALNLNADVFVDHLYPGLPYTPSATADKFPLDLFVYGPGLEGELNLQRKIVKGATYKNWRLDGEFIVNPEDSRDRFNSLAGSDIVVIEFFGNTVPEAARAVFVSRAVPEDESLHSSFDGLVGDRRVAGDPPSMVSMTPAELSRLAENSGTRSDHPIFELGSLDTDLEISTLGDRREATGLRSAPGGRKISREILRRARSNTDRVGELGEQFLNSHLSVLRASGDIENFEWTSLENAGSPYDFRVWLPGEQVLADAKATELGFDNRLHVSVGELRQMGYGAERYDLYRLFEMGETTAKLRVARDLGEWARSVIAAIEGFPEGVMTDSVTVHPSNLHFEPEVEVRILEEVDEPQEPGLFS